MSETPLTPSNLNDGYCYRERVRAGGAGLSVLAYYTRFYPHSTRAEWAARLGRGEVRLEGRQAAGSEVLRAGARLEWHRPPWREEAVPLHFGVVYEDADILAVHKPSGLPTLPAGGFLQHTLLHLLRQRWLGAKPLHRLGRGTSGLVLCGLTREATARLSADWRGGQVHKRYRALAAGAPAWGEQRITAPIGPVPHGKLGRIYATSDAGKPAQSVARVLERRGHSTLLEVDIATGRPHQIRIHLAAVGLPLLGDPLYMTGGHARADAVPSDLGYHLQAQCLCFTHPTRGNWLELHAPVPKLLRQRGEQG